MAIKRGTFSLLLLVSCAALDMGPLKMPEERPNSKPVIKRLLRKCLEKGYQVPNVEVLRSVFNNSDSPKKDSGLSEAIETTFMSILNLVSDDKDSHGRKPSEDKMMNWNYSKLAVMIKQMRSSSEASACYLRAFVAHASWRILITQSEDDADLDDYEYILWASIPMLHDIPFNKIKLPKRVTRQKVEKMMKMLQEEYKFMSEEKRALVVKWVKQRIVQNYFNCTMKPPFVSRFPARGKTNKTEGRDGAKEPLQSCNSTLRWLDYEKLSMIGPYLSHLTTKDIDSISKDQLCKYIGSGKLRMAAKMLPSLARKLHQRVQECFDGEEYRYADKFGSVGCYYSNVPDVNPELSRNLLSVFRDCDDDEHPRLKQLKRRLVKSVASNSSDSISELAKLGNSVVYLPPEQLITISMTDLIDIGKNPAVKFLRGQARTLVKKMMGEIKCDRKLGKELTDLQSVVSGLPSCVFKNVNIPEILNDTEALLNISKRMRTGQLKAMVQALREGMDPSEVVNKLNGPLLQSISLTYLAKAKITSLDQVVGKVWRRAQAIYLVKRLHGMKQLRFRGLHSLLQGIDCTTIDEVPDNDVVGMARDITETPQWLSSWQVACVAQRLVRACDAIRPDYFKTITKEELEEIPTILLSHFPPSKIKDLPDSVCSVFLDKMEVANLRPSPPRSPSRIALTETALLCLDVTNEEASRLGPLLSELESSKLHLMTPEVRNSTLQAMASCQHLPPRPKANLTQLVARTFGDPSEWSDETMEKVGPLLLLDDRATAALPNKLWMKDVLQFLRRCLPRPSDALRRKVFTLITTGSNEKSDGEEEMYDDDDGDSKADEELTIEMMEELGEDVVFLTLEQLGEMTSETFSGAVEILGDVADYSRTQLEALATKAVEAFGPVSQMSDSVLVRMKCIIQGFVNEDLEKLSLSMDVLDEINHCRWSQSQVETMWRTAAKSIDVTQLGAAEIASLSQFICGMNFSELEKIDTNILIEALDTMGKVKCPIEFIRRLKRLLISAFGEPMQWSYAFIYEMGNIMAALDENEFRSLHPSVFVHFRSSSIPLIPPNVFASLFASQLEALGSDNAAALTPEQLDYLTDNQQAAVKRSKTGSVQYRSSVQSGAPLPRMEGISAFLKLLLSLLLGFLPL
ncbi:otoancorin [Brachionichthys hirsutus]|uniref:otoancorin n=1 Tax=Brachionichthys hirsutus TaxID=412623 RepID=UPI0036053445